MDLTVGVRIIEGGKRKKKVVIINEIRRRSAYPSRVKKVSSGDGGATGSRIGEPCAEDKTGDELSGEAADVEESSSSSR